MLAAASRTWVSFAAVASFVAAAGCGKSGKADGAALDPCRAPFVCRTAIGDPPVVLWVSWRGPIPGLTATGSSVRPDGSTEPTAWSCVDADGRSECRVHELRAGTYEASLAAPGYHPVRVTARVAASLCCAAGYETAVVQVAMRPLPTAACIARFAGVPEIDAPAVLGSPTCQSEPDLAPPASSRSTCADVVPPRSEARSLTAANPGSGSCGQPTSDGAGTLTAPMYQASFIVAPPDPPAFWSGDGSWSVVQADPTARVWYPRVVPAPTGFVYVEGGWQGRYPGQRLVVFDGGGNVASVAYPPRDELAPLHMTSPYDVVPDGAGGLLVTATQSCDGNLYGLHALRFSSNGDLVAPTVPVAALYRNVLEESAPGLAGSHGAAIARGVTGGLDATGRLLVVWDGGLTCGPRTLAGRWFGPDGAALGGPFVAAVDVDALPFRLQLLLDGSLALQTRDGAWARRFADGVPAGGPVPGWLAARPFWDLRIVRGGRAYAAIPPDTACAPRIELLSPDGQRCGTLDYPLPPIARPERLAEWGFGSCDADMMFPFGRFVLGLDGTVIRLGDQRGGCVYEWWAGELK